MSEAPESTPTDYSREECDVVREAFRKHELPILCPRCQDEFKASRPSGGGTMPPVYELTCDTCSGSIMVSSGR